MEMVTWEYPINISQKKLSHTIQLMMKLITKYIKSKSESMLNTDVYFGGRLAEYKYYDMHQVI